uniref:SCAN box domain-containing protein n=1 Tax=Canis lupus dingo TaxID=286419 RepID=A0A8C0JP12_CANLU
MSLFLEALKLSMDEALPGPTSENGDSLVKVKEEDPTWEQMCSFQESSCDTRELCRLRFRQFCYQEVTGPREALAQLQELCHQWLRPETHSKEEILELLVLEQFLTILPKELQARVQACHLESRKDVVTMLENLQKDTGDPGQQTSLKMEEEAIQALVTEERPPWSLAHRSPCRNSAQEKVTNISPVGEDGFWQVPCV